MKWPVVPSVTTPIRQGNRVSLTVSGHNMSALVDTGAMISCMSPHVYNQICQDVVLEKSQHTRVQGVGGNSIFVQGKCSVKLVIGGQNFVHTFHVLEKISHSLILGEDFLKQNNANIDFSQHVLSFPTVSVNFVKQGKDKVKSVLARSNETVDIPPHSECLVQIQINNHKNNQGSGMLEPIASLLNRCSIVGARCITSLANDMKFYRIFNPTNLPIAVKKHQPLARFIPVDDINILSTHLQDNSVTQPQVNSIQQQVDDNYIKIARDLGITLQNTDLSKDQKQQLMSLIGANRDCFATSMSELSTTDVYHHEIDTGTAKPIRKTFYRATPTVQKEIDHHIDNLLETGKIEPSLSEWAAPIVMVKKKSGEYRMAVDYRGINEVTEPIHFPLPRFESITDTISAANARIFSTLDLMSGYFQIPVHPHSRHKTAFVSASGQYQFKVMPFGLRNAPHAFQIVMSQALRKLNWESVIIYIDDTPVFSETFSQHLDHLSQVLQCLRENRLKLKPSKCNFAAQEVEYLGHLISKDGLKPNPSKIEVVKNYPQPKKVKNIRAFLGLCNYYRKFIKNYSLLAAPLTNLTKKDAQFQWTPQCDTSFNALKTALTTAPILRLPDFNKQFILYTDASDQAISYILGQKDDSGKECVIEYGARAIRPFERAWHTTDKEGLALVTGILHYHTYLADREFIVYTDHRALETILKNTNLKGRLSRWSLLLQQYRMKIVHKPGKHNTNADGLSRCELSEKTDQEDPIDILSIPTTSSDRVKLQYNFTYATKKPKFAIPQLTVTGIQPEVNVDIQQLLPITTKSIADYQWEDEELKPLILFLQDDKNLPDDDKEARALILKAPDYSLQEGILYHHHYIRGKGPKEDRLCQQLVVPRSLRDDLLRSYHDSPLGGHQGEDRTFNCIRMKYFWKTMFNDIVFYVKSCQECQQAKRKFHAKNAPLQPIPPSDIFGRMHMDIIGPLTKTPCGHRYILLIVDSYSKWCEAFPLKTQEATEIAKIFYSEIICRYGAPDVLVTDRGQNFVSILIQEICKMFQITKKETSAYHPQANAVCERMNSFIEQSLRTCCNQNQTDWPIYLPSIMLAYRTTQTPSTKYSPYFLLFGRECRLPIDTALAPSKTLMPSHQQYLQRLIQAQEVHRQVARENILNIQKRYKNTYDKTACNPNFHIGQQVWLYCQKTQPGLSPKLTKKWVGPYYIVEKRGLYTYLLRKSSDNRIMKSPVHANRLKEYLDDARRPTNPPRDFRQCHDDIGCEELNITDQPGSPQESHGDSPLKATPPDQPKQIDRILKKTRDQRGDWYRVKYKNRAHKPEWLLHSEVPDNLIREFHIHRTNQGHKRKRKNNVIH